MIPTVVIWINTLWHEQGGNDDDTMEQITDSTRPDPWVSEQEKLEGVKKLKQGYDNNTGEHVFWLEYRIKIGPVLEEFDPVEDENKQRRRTYLQELVERIAASEAARLNED